MRFDKNIESSFIDKIKKRYELFVNNEYDIWYALSEYKGEYLDECLGCYIIDFFKEKNIDFSNLENLLITNTGRHLIFKLFNESDKLAKMYAQWSIEHIDIAAKLKTKSEDEKSKFILHIENHFKGWFGELFYCTILNNNSKFYVNKDFGNSKNLNEYSFQCVTPRAIAKDGNIIIEEDYGVDLVGVVSYGNIETSCVIQCKWWNPNEKIKDEDDKKTYDLVSKMVTDGIYHLKFINPYENVKNMFVLWTHKRDDMSKSLLKNDSFKECVDFIHYDSICRNVNVPMVRKFIDKLKEFKEK